MGHDYIVLYVHGYTVLFPWLSPGTVLSLFFRSVGFTGEASEAVHYALHYLKPLLIFDKSPKLNGQIAYEDVVQPRLELPDVFELLHQSNQVTPMLILEAVIGKPSQLVKLVLGMVSGDCQCVCKMIIHTSFQLAASIV